MRVRLNSKREKELSWRTNKNSCWCVVAALLYVVRWLSLTLGFKLYIPRQPGQNWETAERTTGHLLLLVVSPWNFEKSWIGHIFRRDARICPYRLYSAQDRWYSSSQANITGASLLTTILWQSASTAYAVCLSHFRVLVCRCTVRILLKFNLRVNGFSILSVTNCCKKVSNKYRATFDPNTKRRLDLKSVKESLMSTEIIDLIDEKFCFLRASGVSLRNMQKLLLIWHDPQNHILT